MSGLDFRFTITPSQDASTYLITDVTGDYDANTNPGGWGAPNPTQEDLFPLEETDAYITIYNHCTGESIQPLVVDLNFEGLDWKKIPNDFPLNPTALIDVLSTYGISVLPDSALSFRILLKSQQGEEYVNFFGSFDLAITSGLNCCMADAANDFLTDNCKADKKKKWTNLNNNFQAIQYAINCGNFTGACNAITNMKQICNQNGGASCGC